MNETFVTMVHKILFEDFSTKITSFIHYFMFIHLIMLSNHMNIKENIVDVHFYDTVKYGI